MTITKRIQIILITVILILFIPPVIVYLIFYGKLIFRPELFINEWMKFIFSIVSTALAFYLIHVYWSNARKEYELERAVLNASYDLRRLKEELQVISNYLNLLTSGSSIDDYDNNYEKLKEILKDIGDSVDRISKEMLSKNLQELTTILDNICSDGELLIDALLGVSVKEIQDINFKFSENIKKCDELIRRHLRGLAKTN